MVIGLFVMGNNWQPGDRVTTICGCKDPDCAEVGHGERIMKACYIAGPMRGLPGYNYPAFMEADSKLRNVGWITYNPAKMDIKADPEDHASYTVEEQKLHDTAMTARKFAKRDVQILIERLRAEDGDAIVVLPGWWDSVGARAEVAVAEWVSLSILTLQEALRVPYRP